MKEIAMRQFNVLYALKPSHKVKMPITATELAVCDYLKRGSFLLLYKLADTFIFRLLQFFGGDLTYRSKVTQNSCHSRSQY